MKCRGCAAEIEWVWSPNGRAMPVQRVTAVYTVVDDDHAERRARKVELSDKAGQGYYVNHFQTCPQAGRFSRGGR